jgi:hypothetical protein
LATGGVFFYTTPGGLNVDVDNSGDLDFGSTTRQMLNLWGTSYGIGVQNNDEYFRSGDDFFWYVGGSHNNTNGNAGGGTQTMELDSSGNLSVIGSVTASGAVIANGSESSSFQGLVSSESDLSSAISANGLGSGDAVDGFAAIADGVYGQSAGSGAGVEGANTSGSGPAGQFDGNVNITGLLSFGNALGGEIVQMLNLYGAAYGIGIQNNAEYFRTAGQFYWYEGGAPNSTNGSAGGGTTLMSLTASGLTVNGAFVNASDRNLKEHFQAVDAQRVLTAVAALPITRWNYKADTTSQHIGPMAQDFYAAFGVGPDDKHITTIDEGGVALAAIQGLNQKLEAEAKARDAEIAALRQSVADLKQLVQSLAEKNEKKPGNPLTAAEQ